MTGTEPVWTATLSGTRAEAAVAARRYGVPPTMIEAAAERRALGDWRGACAAADVDVDVRVNPDSLRRRYGSSVAEQLLGDLRELAPDLLRWHLPRRAHGAGELLEGLLVPLADYNFGDGGSGGGRLTLAAATPRFALDAGERIVLTVLESDSRTGRFLDPDRVTRALLEGVQIRMAERHSLRRHRMFWSASAASDLSGLCDDTSTGQEITRLQDAGSFAGAWHAAGIDLLLPGESRWLSALPINLPGLASRIRETLPGLDQAALRSGSGAIVFSGLESTTGPIIARAASSREAQGVAIIPTAAWARPIDVDLLRLGLLRAHELHPLVASALLADPPAVAPEPDEWLYRGVPFVEGPCHSSDASALWIQCGPAKHLVAQYQGTWHPLDHPGHPDRELLMARLGGPQNPCMQAAAYLASGRHVIEVVEALIRHGRSDEVRRLLRVHADAGAVLDRVDLPGGGTVGEALTALYENTLQLRMVLAGATRVPDTENSRVCHVFHRRRARKGDPARPHR